ncbi:hypothetical protein LINPERHAP2_LOCUS29061 [Linum perenne]
MGNNLYCRRYTNSGVRNGLYVNESEIPNTAHLKLTEHKDSQYLDVYQLSLKTGPVVTIQPNQVLHIIDSLNIELTTPFQESFVWGESTTKNPHEFKVKRVTLDPMTMVKLKLMATVGTCHVPLTYTLYDVLDETMGQEETHMMDDAVYTPRPITSTSTSIKVSLSQSPRRSDESRSEIES